MAKTKKRRTTLADRYRQQVSSEAQLRFGPQKRGLAQQINDIADQLAGDVNAAHGAAEGVRRSVREARPVVAHSNADAVGAVKAAQDTLAGKLPGALGVTPALSAAAARDAEGTNRRLAESLNNTQTELTSRATDAAAGEAFAVSNARDTASKEGKKLRTALQGLASDQGAFEQGRVGALTETARGRSVTRRGQDKSAATSKGNASAGRDADYLQKFGLTYDQFKGKSPGQRRALIKRANAKKNSGDGSGPSSTGGHPPASATKRQEVMDGIGLAKSQAALLKESGASRSEAGTVLVRGREKIPIIDPKTGSQKIDSKSGQKLAAPKITKVRELYASVALDVLYQGHVGHRNAQELHKLGLTVKDLGLPTAAGEAPKAGNRQAGREKRKKYAQRYGPN